MKFSPELHGLSKDFRLTKFTKLKGQGSKIPQEELKAILEVIKPYGYRGDLEDLNGLSVNDDCYVGIGLDACVFPTQFPDVFLFKTMDFFYPLIDDPYLMGKIACANVLSGLCAMGVGFCDNMLMTLGVSTDLNEQEMKVVTSEMMRGFVDLAVEGANTTVNGGQTVKNPWMIIGGVASTVITKRNIIEPCNAKEGDIIVLTKPLGTQVVINAHQWKDQHTPSWSLIKDHFTVDQIESMYDQAVEQMTQLNKNAVSLMHTYKANACTDVTGFGLLGHAKNLASHQLDNVDFVIHTLPCIKYTTQIEHITSGKFNLLGGTSSETSGGLFICLPKENAKLFIDKLQTDYNTPSWIIGNVVSGSKTARIVDNPDIIEV